MFFLGFLIVASLLAYLIILSIQRQNSSDSRNAGASKSDQVRAEQDCRANQDLSFQVKASCNLLNRLLRARQISWEDYDRFRGILDSKFASHFVLPARVSRPLSADDSPEVAGAKTPVTPGQDLVSSTPPLSTEHLEAHLGRHHDKQDASFRPTAPPPGQESEAPVAATPAVDEIVDAVIVPSPAAPTAAVAPVPATPVVRPVPEPVAQARTAPAPWEIADEPAPVEPQRSLSDVLASFMQERNIRWGELASGILIVGSAVGLVVSLRDELNRTIPYFPALLFMLITAAIHAAGIYTLKKWRLQKTSQGALLIGLLLIPLNFLAACILTEPRQLTDPLYWIAISIGIAGLGTLTTWACQLLFRRGYWPVVIGIMGASVMTLLFNRLSFADGSSWTIILATIPLIAMFVVGSGFWPIVSQRKQIRCDRTFRRVYSMIGIALFSIAVAVVLLLIRAPDKTIALAAITPMMISLSLLVAWLGLVLGDDTAVSRSNSHIITCRALTILGLLIALLAAIGSAAQPAILLVNGIVFGLTAIFMARDRSTGWLVPPAWAALATSVVCLVNLGMQGWALDSWSSWPQWQQALFSGQSGLGLMSLGGAIGAIAFGWLGNRESNDKIRQLNAWSAIGVATAGCLLALIAGLMNRSNIFDTMTASLLLGLAMGGVLIAMAVRPRSEVSHLAAAVTLAALWFTIIWNPVSAGWLANLNRQLSHSSWLSIFSLASLMLSIPTVIAVRRPRNLSRIQELSGYALALASIAIGLGMFLAPLQSGVASFWPLLAVAAFGCVAWSMNRDNFSSAWSAGFVIATAAWISMAFIDHSDHLRLPTWPTPQHWMVQIIVLCLWSSAWAVAVRYFVTAKTRWILADRRLRGERLVLNAVVIAFSVAVTAVLWDSCSRQLVAGYDRVFVSISDYFAWAIAATVTALISACLVFWCRQSILQACVVVLAWCLAWIIPAFAFEDSVAVASATRWLVSIACVVTAFALPAIKSWKPFANPALADSESENRQSMTNVAVNVFLTITIGLVMAISTGTVSRVMLAPDPATALGGPLAESWLASISPEVSYGLPIALITIGLLTMAIVQQRSWLATIGSAVYQYLVILAIVLLFLSPHPQTATSRFLNILQVVSLGMSVYGYAWFLCRRRIAGSIPLSTSGFKLNQLELHTLINGLLVTSLAVLIAIRFYFTPDQAAGWITTAGGPWGIVALVLVSGLIYLVARDRLKEQLRVEVIPALICWSGLVFTAMLAACLDHYTNIQMAGLRTLTWGSVATLLGVCGCLVFQRIKSIRLPDQEWASIPLALTAIVAGIYAMRGGWLATSLGWENVIAISLVCAFVTAGGLAGRLVWTQYLGAACVIAVMVLLRSINPGWLFTNQEPSFVNLTLFLLVGLSVIWVAFYLWSGSPDWPKRFSIFSNIVLLGSSVWILLAGLGEAGCHVDGTGNFRFLSCWTGALVLIGTVAHILLTTWDHRIRFRVSSRCLVSQGISIAAASAIAASLGAGPSAVSLWVSLATTLTVILWSVAWVTRARWIPQLNRWSVPNLGLLEQQMALQLPLYTLIVGCLVAAGGLLAMFVVEPRDLRYLAAMTPPLLAIALGCLSDSGSRRWLQILALSVLTLGCNLVAWADLPAYPDGDSMLPWLVRSLLVLAGAMFIYGSFVARWAQSSDTWLHSLKEMTAATCGLALACSVLVVLGEYIGFSHPDGCGLSIPVSIAVAAALVGMVCGLVTIAIRPQWEAFSFSLEQRKAFVYVAQFVTLLTCLHLYFTMPWLFRFGLEQYWPYVLMALAFSGVAVSQLLKKRELEVLARPLFNTAVILPAVVSLGILAIDSQADPAVVLLMGGLGYLMISYLHQSIWSGVIGIVLGNLALWVFYNKYPDFSFANHPQLWLIPPAVSVLVAGHIYRDRINAEGLAAIRYICLAIIYVSSTSEIFIRGIGDQLWPPMILALLSVAGIFTGIGLQVRAYLYLGSLFLLMAMITMVSHAHQRLDHVWPWWAFGIGLGIAILVMFGLFERRRNKMKALAGRLSQWDM